MTDKAVHMKLRIMCKSRTICTRNAVNSHDLIHLYFILGTKQATRGSREIENYYKLAEYQFFHNKQLHGQRTRNNTFLMCVFQSYLKYIS